MNKSKKLVIYSSLPPVGGHSTITLKIIEAFRQEYTEIVLFTRDLPGHGLCQTTIANLRAQGVVVEQIDKNDKVDWPTFLRRLLQLRKQGVETFLCVGMRGLSPWISKALKPKRSVFYHITHDGREEEFQILAKYSSSFDTMTVISPLSLEPLKKQPNLACDAIWIPQISELAGISQTAKPEKESATIIFGFLGRLSEAKGVALLIDAWSTSPPAADLHLMGEGALEAQVKELVTKSADRRVGRVFYHGAFSASERDAALSNFFSKVDYLCVPSIVVGEGLPTVILESMQNGVPVVTTPIGGTACFQLDWLQPSTPGVIALEDPANFAAKICEIASGPRVNVALRDACRSYYEKWFSTVIVKKLWGSVLLTDEPNR